MRKVLTVISTLRFNEMPNSGDIEHLIVETQINITCHPVLAVAIPCSPKLTHHPFEYL